MTDANLCFDAWTVRKVAMDDNGREEWDDDDAIDYRSANFTGTFSSRFNADDGIIETVNEDDGDFGIDQFNRNPQQQNFNEPWYQHGYNQGE